MSLALLKSSDAAGLAIAAYIGLSGSLVVVGIRRNHFAASPWTKRVLAAVFLLSTLAVLLCGRWQSLRYDLVLNPDEALMAANAMLSQHGWLNWNIVDPLTSGPLNSMILTWPHLFGGDITLFSARLTGIACLYGLALSLFLALRRLSDDSTAIIATAPMTLLIAGVTISDFTHYTSEELSILLISIGVCLFVYSFSANRLRFMISAAFALGMVPFAKLQAAPMAAVVGCFVLARAVKLGLEGGVMSAARNGAAVAVAAVLPAAVFLLPLYLDGGFDDFVNSYFVQQRLRLTSWSNPMPGLLGILHMFHVLPDTYVMSIVIGIVLVGFAAACVGMRFIAAPAIVWTLALGAVLVPVAFASISASGRVFYHYLLLMVPALLTLGGAMLADLLAFSGLKRETSALLKGAAFGIAMVTVSVAVMHDMRRQAVARAEGAFLQGRALTAAQTLGWLRPTRADRMVCWGWQAECYVNSAIPPATREATNENQIYQTSLRPYFRSRFLEDVAKSRPDFVIDTVAPGSFGFEHPGSEGIDSFPEFSKIIAQSFVLLSDVKPPDRCPRLYMRRERFAALERSLIQFASVSATASAVGHPAQALDDRSIFETCDDYWLLPKGTVGGVTIYFHKAEPLTSVAILNTRDGDRGDQASEKVRLSSRLDGETVAVHELLLQPFPRWTYFRFEKPVIADELRIDVLSYRGVGGGLNEVKAYRD